MREYKYYIVVDENKRPMAFSEPDGQLCYCDDSRWLDDPFPVKMVSKKEGLKQISDSIKFRKENGHTIGKYYLMPVDIDPTITG